MDLIIVQGNQKGDFGMVFYFTGTGNSLFIAKQLEENPESIPQMMRLGRREFAAESIGIVAPVYGHEMPAMVKEFLRKGHFHTDYFYILLTYGNRHGGAAELAKQFCEECGIRVDYINVILMAAHQQFLERMNQMPADAWQHLIRISDGCEGCGICEQVCPSGSIRVIDGRARHLPGNCQTCLACVHACPQKAIGLTVPEKNPQARYRNAHISLQEIIRANGAGKAASEK